MPFRGSVSVLFTSQTLTRVALYALGVTAYACIPVWLEFRYDEFGYFRFPSNLHAALGVVLGGLLSFRTNVAYARWWEARTLWGSLVNKSRNLAIKVADLVQANDNDLTRFRSEIIGFAYAMRDHLREGADVRKLKGFEDCTDRPSHVPAYLVTRMYESLCNWRDAKQIDGQDLMVLDEEGRNFLEICGACERIRNTGVIRSYRIFARQCVLLYLVTFPWGIAHDFGWWTFPLTAVIAYFMLGLETVAEHVEEPFGYDDDDLDLDQLCQAIETSVNEVFDRRNRKSSSV
jgi:ion channel-forming bestrophin family protein